MRPSDHRHIKRVLQALLLFLFSLGTTTGYAQTVIAFANPSPANDTIRICEGRSITFNGVAFGFSSPSFNWSFQGGTPLVQTGSGPHAVTYNSTGNFTAALVVFDGVNLSQDTIYVVVSNTYPTASFTPPATSFCSSDSPFSLTGGSPAGGYYSGPGVTNGVFDPDAAGPGTHSICYTAVDPGGCTDTECQNFTVIQGPDASIADQDIFTPFANCVAAGGSSTYTLRIDNISTTTASNNSYYIDWGDGSPAFSGPSLPNGTSHTYSGLGNYTITLAVSAPNGCTDTATYNFFNGQNPNVGVGIGSSQGCIPFTLDVPILNTTNNPPGTTYEIDFGDGTVMNFNHPPPDTISYTYTTTSCGTTDILGNPNSFYVRIRATNPCGTTQAVASPIEVSRAPDLNLQAVDSTVCVGQAVLLQDLSDSAFYVSGSGCSFTYTRDWFITPATGWTITGANSPNPTVTFTDTGYYQVCLSGVHPCGSDTACIEICVGDEPDIDIQTSTNGTCAPLELVMYNDAPFFTSCFPTVSGFVVDGPDSAWSTINGTSVNGDSAVFRFDTSGTYTVTYFARNECDSIFYDTTLVIGDDPIVELPPDAYFCELDTLNIGDPGIGVSVDTNNSSVIEYRWHLFPATGWSYTGGTGQNSREPLVAFTDTGTYQVCLAVETECGVDSTCRFITFYSGPGLDVTDDTTICYNTDIALGVEVLTGNGPFTYDWSTVPPSGFGSNSDSVTVSGLTNTTTYRVRVTDSLGCESEEMITVTVNPELLVDAGPDQQICAGDTFYLNGTISGGSSPYTISWYPDTLLVDGTIEDPVAIGILNDTTFILTVTDSLGCSQSDTVEISVFQPILEVNAGPDTTYCNSSTIETLQGYSPPGGTWTGNGVVNPDGFDPSAAGTGTHELIYSYTDGNGCFDQDTVLITVVDPVPPVAGPDTIVCINSSPVTLTGTPAGGTWTINGSPSLLSGNTFLPNTTGTFELYYTTGYGSCEFSDTITITVNERPSLGGPFVREICSGDSILFNLVPDIPGSSTAWSAVSTGAVTVVTPSGTTSIRDTLFNTSSGLDTVVYEMWAVGPAPTNCEGDTTTLTVVVHPIPQITNPTDSFEVCSGEQFVFVPTSDVTGTTFDIVVQSSDPGITGALNGSGSISDFLFNTGSAGYVHYRIYTTGPSPADCAGDSFDLYVQVHPLPVADAGPDLNYCSQDSVQIQANLPAGVTWTWTPATGLTQPTDTMPWVTEVNHTGSPVTLTYVLTVVDTATGCLNRDTVEVTVNPLPAVDPGPDASICIGDSISIGTTNDAAYTYQWSVVGSPPFSTDGVITVQPTVSTTYRLMQADTATGCTDSADVTITVIPAPVAGFTAVPDSGCTPLNVTLTDTSTPGVSHEWYLNGVLFSNQQNPGLNLANTSNQNDSTVTVMLVVTAGTGCSDSASYDIVIHPAPDAGFSLPTPFCAPDSVTATQSGTYPAGTTFQWGVSSPAVQVYNSTSDAASFVFPDFQGNFDSTYTVWLVATSPFGCADSVAQNVTVFARPTAGFTIPSNACGPASITVTNLSSGTGLLYGYSTIPNIGVVITNPSDAEPDITFPASFSDSVVYTVYQTVTDGRGCTDVDSASFTVYPSPTADFNVSANDSCGPFTVNFANVSTPNQTGMDINSMTFDWNFGNGNTSNVQDPTETFVNNGEADTTYYIRLIATNAFGCSDTIIDSITVHPDPIADFTANPSVSCAPFTIDTSAIDLTPYPDANDQYVWQIIDPATQNIIQIFNGPDAINYIITDDGDTVIVRLVVSSPHGCTADTMEIPFISIEDPVAGFSPSADSACHPLNLTLTDTSTSGVTHEWFLDGVLFSTSQNPSLVLTNTGTINDSVYTIQLIVTAASGCSDTTEMDIVVWPNPIADFTASEVCDGEATLFTDQSSAAVTITDWAWDFGDGNSETTASPTHQYSGPGEYAVSLTVTDARGCTHTLTDTVIVRPRPAAEFGATSTCGTDTVCQNLPATFFDLSTVSALGGAITSWNWDVDGDGSADYFTDTISHAFTGTGTATVELIVETQYGCTDTISHTYFILSPPTADFSLDTNYGCGPLQVNATNLSTGLINTYHWEVYANDDNGNRVVLYSANTQAAGTFPTLSPSNIRDTTYYIELTVGNCCGFDTITRTAVVRSNPSAGLLPDNTLGCSPMTVEFQLDGEVNGSPDFIIMDYGDGTVDTVYRQPLILPNGDTTYVWGAPTHQYYYNGSNLDTTYSVRQYVVNPCGIDSADVNITVRRATVNAFIDAAPRMGCFPLTVTFANASYRSQNFTWCLDYDTITGNCNQPAVGDTLVYTYQQPGTYTVALFANDNCSFDTTFVTIEVYDRPNVQFTADPVCVGDTTVFVNTTSIGDGFINSYQWNFGDGNTSFLVNPTHIYAAPGIYPVTLVVNTTDGCPDTLTRNVVVHPGPVVNFNAAHLCFNEQPVVFDNLSDTMQTTIASTSWDFGDGNTSTQFEPSHTYASPGVYTITLIHETSNGCIDSLTQEITIYPLPVAAFDTTKITAGVCGAPQIYQFDNLSTGASRYEWDFDINNPGQFTDTTVSPQFTFNTPGIYTVQLITLTDFGCSDTATTTVEVPPYPAAGFTLDSTYGCVPLPVSFTEQATYNFPNGQIVEYYWDFGDGTSTTTTNSNVNHTYDDPGVYTVTLVVTTDRGCSDTLSMDRVITVYPRPEAAFTYQINGDGTVQFINQSQFTDGDTRYVWDFGDGTFSTQQSPLHDFDVDRYEKDHYFDVCLLVDNDYGCPDSICHTLELLAYRLVVPNAFAPELTGVGDGNVFLPKGNNIAEYHLEIFDAYGNLVFESTELSPEEGIPSESWNGTFMNEGQDKLPSGAYVWKIRAVFVDGAIWPGKRYEDGRVLRFGTVTLIR